MPSGSSTIKEPTIVSAGSFSLIAFSERDIPKGADLDDFETISVQNKAGEQITLYRNKLGKEELDETSNFNRSWDIFNSHLN